KLEFHYGGRAWEAQRVERLGVRALLAPGGRRGPAVEIVLAHALAGAERAHPLQIAHDRGFRCLDPSGIETERRHAPLRQIRRVGPFAREDAQVGDADAGVPCHPFRFAREELEFSEVGRPLPPSLPPFDDGPAQCSALYVCGRHCRLLGPDLSGSAGSPCRRSRTCVDRVQATSGRSAGCCLNQDIRSTTPSRPQTCPACLTIRKTSTPA